MLAPADSTKKYYQPKDQYMHLYCGKCNIPVPTELKEHSDNSLINEKDGESYLPQSYYFISDGSYFTDSESKMLINCADLVNCVNHPDGKRLNGCCGAGWFRWSK